MSMKLLGSALLLLLAGGVPASCGAREPTSEEEEPRRELTTVAEICAEPAGYEDREVTLEGSFQGWRVDRCELCEAASRTTTRSDWLIRTGEECLYVTGGMPDGLDPIDPESLDRRLRLVATVRAGKDGKVFLEHLESHALDK